MISVEKASGIYAKLCAGERITADEREELEEYAKRFSNPTVWYTQTTRVTKVTFTINESHFQHRQK